MNFNKLLYFLLITLIFTSACKSGMDKSEKEVIPKAPVTVTGVIIGPMTDYAELTATSTFFDNAVVKAPVTGYIESSLVNPGDKVMKNQKIMTMRTKEAVALKGDTSGLLGFSGEILIKSGINGVVTSMDHPIGDYVQEGDRLGIISVPASLVFLLDAPFDLNSFIRIGNRCDVLLPDGSSIEGRITSRLPSMAGASQTQRFVIEPAKPPNLPENLIARVRIPKNSINNAVMLPKACILTDEIMKNFWVMKLINDSMAVKISIQTGLTGGDNVQIVEPRFSLTDLFLSSGNYGLGDTARVLVVKKKE
ncbi:MAG: HlyD family efflux transporter periplasmic adaptor subunit [Bacteroidetes bacterium]|nr:HlyD family efflux transporter periplasmic adaptor subunit [Bacteroidota bacterium]